MLAILGAVTGDDCRDHATTRHRRPVDIVPFEAWHLQWLKIQASQSATWMPLTLAYGQALKGAGPCYSAFAGADVIACAGVMNFWEGRAMVWSLLSDQMPEYRKVIHRAVKNFLNGCVVRRLECTIDPRSEAAKRWATHLGFRYESTMPGYTPLGETQELWVRF